MKSDGLKIGEPGIHHGRVFRQLNVGYNRATHQRDAQFVSPLLWTSSGYCNLPVLVMLEAFTNGKARTAVGPEYTMAKWAHERRNAHHG